MVGELAERAQKALQSGPSVNAVATPPPGWIVQLAGDEFDWKLWERSLNPPFDPWCEKVPNGASFIWALRSATFNQAQSAEEVWECAVSLIERLNGALHIQANARPLRFNGVGHIDDTGTVRTTVFAVGKASTRPPIAAGIGEARDVNGNLLAPPPPQPSQAQKWAAAAEKSEDIGDMLVFLGRADNWFDLYKAIELAERLSGGQHELLKLLGSSAPHFKNMRTTANFYRHARTHRPTTLITLNEAKPLLSFVVRTVLTRCVE